MEDGGGDEATEEGRGEEGPDVLNMSSSVFCFAFVVPFVFAIVLLVVVVVLTAAGVRDRSELDLCPGAQ